MTTLHWTQTVACTKPIPKPRVKNLPWVKIYDGVDEGVCVQFWICRRDLKENFVHEAQLAFGKTLDQCIQLGTSPQVLYPEAGGSI